MHFVTKAAAFAVFLSLISNFSALTARSQCGKSIKKACCVIKARDINRNGFVIKKGGNYCLEKGVLYDPCDGNPAIRISASNVTLDLNGNTLSQINKNVHDMMVLPLIADSAMSLFKMVR